MQCVEERSGSAVDARQLLSALDAFKKGDFSVRLDSRKRRCGRKGCRSIQRSCGVATNASSANWNGSARSSVRPVGLISGPRLGEVGGSGSWAHAITLGQHAHQQSGPPDGRNGPRDRCRGEGRPVANDGAGNQQAAAARRVLADREDRQPHGEPARVVRVGSDARGPRSGHRRQARRPGQSERRRRHLEGSHRQREPHGRQSHRPGSQHRRRDDGRRQRRLDEKDHGRREGRVPRAQETPSTRWWISCGRSHRK